MLKIISNNNKKKHMVKRTRKKKREKIEKGETSNIENSEQNI